MSSGRNEVKINDFFKTRSQDYHCQPSHRRRKDYKCLVGMIKDDQRTKGNTIQQASSIDRPPSGYIAYRTWDL